MARKWSALLGAYGVPKERSGRGLLQSRSQRGATRARDDERHEDEAQDRHELHQDVERRAGGVFERVADGVADDGGLVRSEPLPPWLPVSMYFFALSQAPPALDDEQRHDDAADRASRRAAPASASTPKSDADDERACASTRMPGLDHSLQRRVRGDGDAARVVGPAPCLPSGRGSSRNWRRTSSIMPLAALPTAIIVCAVNRNGRTPPTRRPRRHDRRRAGRGVSHVSARVRNAANSASAVSTARADGEAFADRGRRVAGGVEHVGALADLGAELRHLGDAAGVVGDRAVGVDRQADGDRRDHADGGDGDAVHAGEVPARRRP